MTAIALTIAGSDSSGGAGIQADLKTFAALGVYGASAITALTAQNTKGVAAIWPVPSEFLRAQLEALADDLAISAIKIGMLPDAAAVETVADALAVMSGLKGIPVIVDPVMAATSGDALADAQAITALRESLLSLAELITPNLFEAARLLDVSPAENEAQMIAQAEALRQRGARAVLIKGGHLAGETALDILCDGAVTRYEAPRVPTKNTHGTGCTLSSAIAAERAKGESLRQAIRKAKDYLTEALRAADRLEIGQGHGPVHYFHRYWPDEEA